MKVLFLLLWALSLFASAPYITSTMTMQEFNKLTASDASAGDEFGRSVAISGDTVIVGVPGDDSTSGSAYIYRLNHSTGLFEQTVKLTASDAAAGDSFGYSVAISEGEGTVIVGAHGNDSNSGSAYLFNRNCDSWIDTTETAKLTASDAVAGDSFGYSVAISYDAGRGTVIVGAHGDDSNSGSAYLFREPVIGSWKDANQTAKLTASDAAADDYFGLSVAISGDTVIVGADGDEDGGKYSGSAYLFEKPEGGWIDANQTVKLTASDAETYNFFGYSVAISGDTVIVGAYRNYGGASDSGSAYLFEKPSSGWINTAQTAKLTASDATVSEWFGRSVAISGDRVIVGAHKDDEGGSDSGSVYLFEKPASGWTDTNQTSKLTASDASASDNFGRSVAISGDTVIVGAYHDDEGGSESGSAYIFKNTFSENTLENKRDIIDINASDDDGDSISFSIVGGEDASFFDIDAVSGLLSFKNPPDFETPRDANGDNIYRVTLKISDDSSPSESSITQAYIRVSDMFYEGKAPKAISFKELNTLRVDNSSDFGRSVAISGDTAVVSTTGYSVGNAYIYEYNSSTDLFIQKARLGASDYAAGDRFGHSVAISGDIVIVGAYGDNDAGDQSGSAYLFEKPIGGWIDVNETAKLTASDAAEDDWFAYSVAISGNTVIVGAYWDDSYTGSAYFFEKPVGGWVTATQTAKLTASDAAEDDEFGHSVSISGDTVIIGAFGDNDGGYNSGSAYIYKAKEPLSSLPAIIMYLLQ